jgi:hypothetical protein
LFIFSVDDQASEEFHGSFVDETITLVEEPIDAFEALDLDDQFCPDHDLENGEANRPHIHVAALISSFSFLEEAQAVVRHVSIGFMVFIELGYENGSHVDKVDLLTVFRDIDGGRLDTSGVVFKVFQDGIATEQGPHDILAKLLHGGSFADD